VITLTVELTPEQAAGLARFAEKVTYSDAQAVLYPHVSKDIRDEQAYQILAAFDQLSRRLLDAGVESWPWIDNGRVYSANKNLSE